MKRQLLVKKRFGSALAMSLAVSVAVGAAGTACLAAPAGTFTDEEIENRIDEVGEAYLAFYREGREEAEEEDGFQTFPAANAPAAGTVYESAAYEAVEAKESAMMPLVTPLVTPLATPFPGSNITVEDRLNTEEYAPVEESGFVSVKTQPFSTFGADVDTASYSSLRRKLLEPLSYGENPCFTGIDDSAIRIEEMMNYFRYDYAEPEEGEKFGVTTALAPCPWNEDALLFKAGIQAEALAEENKGSNIVFLIDTSGSMFDFDKLPLVKKSLNILTEELDESDCVSIVTYAGSEEVALEGAGGDEKERIMDAVNALEAWGSTYGEGGIEKAYEIAGRYFIEGGNNRVVLCTDGDFNVGVTSEAGLTDLISKKRESGIFFSCLGFGGGNYSDTTMETLADNGNGNYFYIDCEREAERALSEEFFSTIYTVAKDTKFQVEFNPETVKGYRIIGYENRKMAAEDFADDTKDGGEVGAGQCVTVLYEVIPAGSSFDIPEVTSRYGKAETETASESSDLSAAESVEQAAENPREEELLVVNIRYKDPDGDTSELREYPVSASDVREMDADTSWAAGVAQAGMVMRDSAYAGTTALDDVYDRLKEDPEIMDNDYKAEFLYMLRAMKKYREEVGRDQT